MYSFLKAFVVLVRSLFHYFFLHNGIFTSHLWSIQLTWTTFCPSL